MRIVPPVILRGSKAIYIMGGSLEVTSHEDPSTKDTFKGLRCNLKEIPSPNIKSGSDGEGQYDEVVVPDYFPPGSVLVFATHMDNLTAEVDALCVSGAKEAFSRLDVVDLNLALFRAEGEERDATGGRDGVYVVPDLGPLVYCGLEGFMHPLRHIMRNNDLGHPLCAHLRNGCWAMDYVYGRLMK
jgi:glycogen debranching enzyme